MDAFIAIRPAALHDVSALESIENACFAGNRISRRSFLAMLRRGNGATLVDVRGGQLRGYLMLLFRRNSSVARIYSIATAPAHAGQGVAAGLLAVAEQLAQARGCTRQRLEVRQDNAASLGLFASRGYQVIGMHARYYHDGMDAYRLEKRFYTSFTGA